MESPMCPFHFIPSILLKSTHVQVDEIVIASRSKSITDAELSALESTARTLGEFLGKLMRPHMVLQVCLGRVT